MDLRICFYILLLHAFTLTSGEPPIKLPSATYTDELVGLTSRLIDLTPPASPNASGVRYSSFILEPDVLEFLPNSTSDLVNGVVDVAPPEICDGISTDSGIRDWSSIQKPDMLGFTPNSSLADINGVDLTPPECCDGISAVSPNACGILDRSTSADIDMVDGDSQLKAVESVVTSIVSSSPNNCDIPPPPPEFCDGISAISKGCDRDYELILPNDVLGLEFSGASVADTEKSRSDQLMEVELVSFIDAYPNNCTDFRPPEFSDGVSATGSAACVILPDMVGIPPSSGEPSLIEETNRLMTTAKTTTGGKSSRQPVSGSVKINNGRSEVPAKRLRSSKNTIDEEDEGEDSYIDADTVTSGPLPESEIYAVGTISRGMVQMSDEQTRWFSSRRYCWLTDVETGRSHLMRLKEVEQGQYVLEGGGWSRFIHDHRLRDGDEVWFILALGEGESYMEAFKNND